MSGKALPDGYETWSREDELGASLRRSHAEYAALVSEWLDLKRKFDAMTLRAEAAEARLKGWETAANNNDPYLTNGGYVEVEVLEAVKRRNAELLADVDEAKAKYLLELQYRLTLSRTVSAELRLLNGMTWRAEKWKARAEALEERNDTTPLDAIKTVLEYSDFHGWGNAEAEDAFRKLGDWLQFRR